MPALHELFIHDVRLKQLHLQNFRGFGEMMLDFQPDKPVTVLIADNGGGKSTILDAAAEFLRRFFQLAIAGQSEEEANKQSFLGEKDIFNERNNASASAILNLSYPYPDKEVFQWMDECVRHLNEYYIEGEEATLWLEENTWVLQLKQKLAEEYITYYLPDEYQEQLNLLASDDRKAISTTKVDLKVATYDGASWQPNLSLTAQEMDVYSKREGSLELLFQLTRGRPDSMKHISPHPNPKTYTDVIKAWEAGEGFISDYAYAASGYNRNNPLDETLVVLPLLAYYGGGAINAKYENELKVPYRPSEFKAYFHAFEPERFDFEEFLAWALWANERQEHAWKCVRDTMLDVLNADPSSVEYAAIQIEAQTLVFYKKTGIATMPVEAAQLSAGEKNIMALTGDLAKRAVQLNAVLFSTDVDFHPEASTFSNPLQYTPGIVLIDEIDLHLHPCWQRVIMPKLREHFPRVQFVVTTHSPFVLQSVEIGNIVTLPHMEQSTSLSGWEIYEIIQNKMAEEGDSMSDRYQRELQKFNQAILYDNQNELEDSYQWLIKHLHPDNPKKPAIEMQYNVFSKKGEYNEKA